jgi:predicted secreted protein
LKHRAFKPVLAGLLLIAMLAPAASAGIGTAPASHWSFKFDDRGVWQAVGDHVSFSWTLKPFEVYDLMVDGTLLVSELSFPVDATDYMTEGATFKVMMGNHKLFQLQDNPSAEMGAMCSARDPATPPDPCDIEFPTESIFEVYQRGHNTQYHIEGARSEGGIVPCIKVTTQGESSLDGTTIMFEGSLNFRAPPGLSMQELLEG